MPGGAKSVSSHNNGNKGVEFKAMVDATPSGIPVKVGPKVEWKSERVSETKFEGGEDFVFAYQLRKLVCSKKQPLKKDEAYLKGALFDADAKKSEEMEIEVEVAEEDLDGLELEDAEVIRIQDEAEGKDDVCVIIKADD